MGIVIRYHPGRKVKVNSMNERLLLSVVHHFYCPRDLKTLTIASR